LNEKVSNLTFKNIDEELSKFIKKIRICWKSVKNKSKIKL
jgi:hypothetical protein